MPSSRRRLQLSTLRLSELICWNRPDIVRYIKKALERPFKDKIVHVCARLEANHSNGGCWLMTVDQFLTKKVPNYSNVQHNMV
jgi:hypothetical protein